MKAAYIRSITKAYYNLVDEDNYNVYEAEDIAQYLGLDISIVNEVTSILYEAGYLQECMTLEDDGSATFCLNDKGIDLVEEGN